MTNQYKTLKTISHSLHKVKSSKHYGFAIPVKSVEEVESALADLRKQHHAARHHCYAWRIGAEMENVRTNDAGEPANSAGPPILGQIKSFELTNVLIVVVRYFGGTKLGVGGLIQAYKTAAQMAIEANTIVDVELRHLYQVKCNYTQLSDILQIIRHAGIEIADQEFSESCTVKLALPERNDAEVEETFAQIPDLKINYIGIEEYEL